MPLIEVNKKAFTQMKKDAENSFPNECCGFFFGKEENGKRAVYQSTEVINSKEGDQRRRFEISTFDYMKAEQYALENDLDLLGVYHSHPQHPAIASKHDLAKAMPYFSYIILSVLDGAYNHIKSWRLKDEVRQFEEEKIIIQS